MFEIGQQRGKIAGLGDDRTGGGAEIDAKLARDDLGERGLAKARRPEEQHVIHRLAPLLGAFDEDLQVVLGCRLSDELGQRLGPQRSVLILDLRGGGEKGVIGHLSWQFCVA